MKIDFIIKTGIAAGIFAVTAGITPALAQNTSDAGAEPIGAAGCVKQRGGFNWNICDDKELRKKIAAAGAPGGAPGPAGPIPPVGGGAEEEKKSLVEETLGAYVDGGGGDR